ncbi:MAG: histidine kinase [Burkholderiales bacterium]|nr:histidine kinase [Burkholderiales bacterium]
MPNFRNLGILLRILLLVNVVAVAAAVVKTTLLRDLWKELLDISAVVQPLLILSLLALVALSGVLRRLPYAFGVLAVIALEFALTALLHGMARTFLGVESASLGRHLLLVFIVTILLLLYFELRSRALSPALTEARLQALQARIRPHFLFNSINAVLSLIRQDPKRAETALEDMADLFRVLMADNRELAPLAKEVELCRQYLALEQLRLGERLRVEWRVDRMPGDALVPPLVLQPLLENAVYHGIEPRVEPGVVSIDIHSDAERVHAVLRNPYRPGGNHHTGNRMALANIRERLQLHFDAEAALSTNATDDAYEVRIVMPYVKGVGHD